MGKLFLDEGETCGKKGENDLDEGESAGRKGKLIQVALRANCAISVGFSPVFITTHSDILQILHIIV